MKYLLTKAELAAAWKVTTGTIDEWCRLRGLPYTAITVRTRRFDPDKCQAWLDKQGHAVRVLKEPPSHLRNVHGLGHSPSLPPSNA